MKRIVCHFDVISPYSWLALDQLPKALMGLSYELELRPVLLAALLRHHGQLGPAEIPGKREWTYRQVMWLARQQGSELQLPAAHPFNPLPLLRLALACSEDGRVNRYVAEAVLRHVWVGGADPADPQRLAELRAQLQPRRDPESEAVKADLRSNTEAALLRGAFGVPTFEVDGRLFWGLDSLGMLRACLEGDPWFDGPEWQAAGRRPGFRRAR